MTKAAGSPPSGTPPWAAHVLIPTLWTSEQALALVELLDDLRDAVASLHARQIQHLLQHEQTHGDAADVATRGEDPTNHRPF